ASRKSAETSGHALRRTTEDENWGCANWRPKDARLPWRPQLEREDFRGSLGAADTSGKRFLTETSLAQLTTAQQLVPWLVESVRATSAIQTDPLPAAVLTCLRQSLPDHAAPDIRKPEIPALVTVSQLSVFDTETVQHGCLQVVNVHFVLDGKESEFVRLTHHVTALHATTREPHIEC